MSKSVIQTIVLLLLLIIAGGAYLYWQDGGFGGVARWFGAEPQTPAPVPQPTPPPPVAKDPAPSIPSQPVAGQLQGSAFVPDAVELEGSVLTFRQGDGPLAAEVKVFLYTQPWTVPTERSFKLLKAPAGEGAPHVRVRLPEPGQNAPRQRDYGDKYTLVLELGKEQDRRVPGKIHLTLPDDDGSRIAGTFVADIRGFRLVNGQPDLSSDSIDTLQFLALRKIVTAAGDRAIKDLSFQQGQLDRAHGKQLPSGYLEVSYRVGDAPPTVQKFQYVKENGTWRVVRRLRPDQIAAAHPYQPPAAVDAPPRLFPYLAAKRIEAEVQRRYPNRLVNGTEFTVRVADGGRVGVCEAAYRIDGQLVQTTFLYRRGDNGWRLLRELSRKERVNLATGKVEVQR